MSSCSICDEGVDVCDFCQSGFYSDNTVYCFSDTDGDERHFCSYSCWEAFVVELAERFMFKGTVIADE